jgi:hypothetical protein
MKHIEHPTPDETTELSFLMASAVLDPKNRPRADRAIAAYRKKYPRALTKQAEERLWHAVRLRVAPSACTCKG